LAGDPGLALKEANERAALHQIVDELDRTDLAAVFNLARLLVLVPGAGRLFEWMERDRAVRLRLWVERGVLPAAFLCRERGPNMLATSILLVRRGGRHPFTRSVRP
jgi:hypothetical protein